MKRREIEWRWELETKKMKIPTVAEAMKEESLTLEKAAAKSIIICGKTHKVNNVDCFRKLNGHKPCDGCPKYSPEKTVRTTMVSEWSREISF